MEDLTFICFAGWADVMGIAYPVGNYGDVDGKAVKPYVAFRVWGLAHCC